MKESQDQFNWREYQWGQEICRDERRISCYFQELPSCLDLPGEENMIFDNLFSQVDLVPANGKSDSLRSWEVENDEEWEEFHLPHRLVMELDKLAVEWNLEQERYFGNGSAGLGIACLFGKLIARVSDFLDPDLLDFALKRTLGKHAVQDLNELAGSLKDFSKSGHILESSIEPYLEMLGHIRENLLTELNRAGDRDTPFL